MENQNSKIVGLILALFVFGAILVPVIGIFSEQESQLYTKVENIDSSSESYELTFSNNHFDQVETRNISTTEINYGIGYNDSKVYSYWESVNLSAFVNNYEDYFIAFTLNVIPILQSTITMYLVACEYDAILGIKPIWDSDKFENVLGTDIVETDDTTAFLSNASVTLIPTFGDTYFIGFYADSPVWLKTHSEYNNQTDIYFADLSATYTINDLCAEVQLANYDFYLSVMNSTEIALSPLNSSIYQRIARFNATYKGDDTASMFDLRMNTYSIHGCPLGVVYSSNIGLIVTTLTINITTEVKVMQPAIYQFDVSIDTYFYTYEPNSISQLWTIIPFIICIAIVLGFIVYFKNKEKEV